MWLALVLLWLAANSRGNVIDNNLDVEAVKEVESLLAKDPNLPRLTRGEILSLISEIRQGKDVMIVLPQNVTTTTTTPKPTRKTIKRRRKPVRPVYRQSTTTTTTSTTENPTQPSFKAASDNVRPIFVTPELTFETSSTVKLSSTTVRPTETTPGFSTTTKVGSNPDVFVAAESLGPDMKELLSSFGLLGPVATTEKITYQGDVSPTVDPSSYSRFKPLSFESEGMSPDMKSFLSSYGLLDNRKSKSVNIDPVEQLPGKDVLQDLGVAPTKNNFIFNPRKLSKNNTEELQKVNEILTRLREISEGNATDLNSEEVKELLALENGTRLAEQDNIDPLSDNFTLSELKNEIKRQQPNSTTAEPTEPPKTTPLDDDPELLSGDTGAVLGDSFGGTGDTTTAKPNGFYFLFDWNSFIDVGTEDEPRKVNINFSPKVGDPRNFISVKIP
ncbi:location of vulva defective 1 isoform X1 [Cimex lectularius]|uniref:Uncharacterized protein n=1 Tax=Cimex lectularius TaxID=79782 RepID=A0A8I6R763_CIMLE|nr:location of vulva defective 1 isoform X2 [Cimex lectularius]XP_014240018.1 location of vulva defective 1 isoform X1 [Cimex lectularius]